MKLKGTIRVALWILDSSVQRDVRGFLSIHRGRRTTTNNSHLTCLVICMHWWVFLVIYGVATIPVSWVIAVDGLRHATVFYP